MSHERPRPIDLVMASVAVAAIAFLGWRAACAEPPRKPVPVGPGQIVDSPIPPGGIGGVQVTQGTGYCVTYLAAGNAHRVDVPFHKPDPAKLDELRGSVQNALSLIANQLDVKAATEPDDVRRGVLAHEAGKLHEKIDRGVRFAGEPGTLTPENRPVQVGPGGGVLCTCATLCGDACGAADYCGGACGGCWRCQ